MKWLDGRRRESLPIDNRLDEVLSLLGHNQVVIVEAETGAGKTTRIPQAYLLEHPNERIYMTQPRRAAVRWNGKRIAGEMGEVPGGVVGWRLFGDDPVVSDRTRLTLTIDQSLANGVRRNGGNLPDGLIVIDEAHERGIPNDLLLGLIKEGLAWSPDTRVLVTSATIDAQKFSAFFDGAPTLLISGRCYPVSTQVWKMEHAEHHTQGAARAAVAVMEQFLKGELVTPTADGDGSQIVEKGTVIVLLPGKDDIKDVVRSLEWAINQDPFAVMQDRVEVLTCHGESSSEEQDRVQVRVPDSTIRFVCATEMLRTSVTLPEVVGVVDSLQIKRPSVDARGVTHLAKISVSRAEADQAKGRAGRTGPGFYIPVSFNNEYASLKPYPTPAILMGSVESVALQVAAISRSVRNFAFIDKPDETKVEVALERLRRLGALNEAEEITEVGELLVRFPIDPSRAKVLITADRLGVLSEAVIVTATLEEEGFFFRPRKGTNSAAVEETVVRVILSEYKKPESSWDYWKSREEPLPLDQVDITDLPEWIEKTGDHFVINCAHHNCPSPSEEGARWVADFVRKHWANGSQSDFVAIVRCYRAFKTEEYRLRKLALNNRAAENELRAWCERWFVNFKRIRVAEDTMHQIREELDDSPLEMRNGLTQDRPFDYSALTKALASGLIDFVARKTESNRGRVNFMGPAGDFQISNNSVCPPGSQLVLTDVPQKIPYTSRRGETGFFLMTDTAAPLEAEWLVEVMPQLCTQSLQGDFVYNPSLDEVTETRVDKFADLELQRVRVAAKSTTETAKVLAKALVDNEGYDKSIHPSVIANSAVRARLKNLWHRSLGQTPKPEDSEIVGILAERLGAVSSLAEADKQGIHLCLTTHQFVSQEDEYAVLDDAPPFFMLGGHICSATYEYYYYSSETPARGTIRIDEEAAVYLTAEDIPTFRHWSFQITRNGQNVDSGFDLAQLQRRIEERRIKKDWDEAKAQVAGLLSEDLWDLISVLGSSIEITSSVIDGQTVPVLGFVSLDRYYSSEPRLTLVESSAEAISQTRQVLATLAVGTIPSGERDFSDGGWSFYQSVQGELNRAVEAAKSAMSWAGIDDAAKLQTIVAELRKELAGIRQAAEQRLRAKSALGGKFEAIVKEVAEFRGEVRRELTSGQQQFVSAELARAEELIERSTKAISSWQKVAAVISNCRQAKVAAMWARALTSCYDLWLAKAQEMTAEVEALRDRIDWEKSAIYGLSKDESNESRYSSSNGLRSQAEAARKLAFGDSSGYNTKPPQPRQAIEALKRLRTRLQQAIDYAADNVGAEAEAEALMGQIEAWRDKLHRPCCSCEQWGDGVVFEHAAYRSAFGDLAVTADERYRESNYLGVVALADELKAGVAKLESQVSAFLAQRQNLRNLLAAEYSVCPACGQTEWSGESGSCDCLGYEEVESGTVLKRSAAADGRLFVSVEVGGRWNQVSITVHDRQVPALAEIQTEVLWTGPSEEEKARRQREREAKRWRQEFEEAQAQVASGQILELSFRMGKNPKTGENQWEAGDRKVKYLLDRWCHHTPVEGPVYFCSLGKNLVNTGQFELWTVHIVPPYPEEAPEDFVTANEVAEVSEDIEPKVQTDEGAISDEAKTALLAKFGRR